MTITEKVREACGREEFWQGGTEEALVKYVKDLKKKGFTEQEALDIVSGIFSCGCSEYGG